MIQFSTDGPIEVAKDAATIIVYRKKTDLQIFMVKRSARSKFMASAMVFPGGRLDEGDLDEAWKDVVDLSAVCAGVQMGETDGHRARALMVAAVRETFEEAGLLITSANTVNALESNRLELARQALNGKTSNFIDIIKDLGVDIALSELRFVAHWITPKIEKRRFDARFFAAQAPHGQLGCHDDHETTASEWLSPREALERYAAGTIELAPPTLRILLEIDADPSWLLSDRHHIPNPIQPQLNADDGELHLLLPGDPQFKPPGKEMNRISRIDDRWVSIGRGA